MVRRGIKSRFKEASECQKVIEKASEHSFALRNLEKVATSLEQFKIDWTELTLAGLPLCWEPSNVFLQPLLVYECRLIEEMNRTNTPSEKFSQLKAETIVSILSKEFLLLHQVKYRIPTQASYAELTEAYIRVETFTAIPEPAVDTW